MHACMIYLVIAPCLNTCHHEHSLRSNIGIFSLLLDWCIFLIVALTGIAPRLLAIITLHILSLILLLGSQFFLLCRIALALAINCIVTILATLPAVFLKLSLWKEGLLAILIRLGFVTHIQIVIVAYILLDLLDHELGARKTKISNHQTLYSCRLPVGCW